MRFPTRRVSMAVAALILTAGLVPACRPRAPKGPAWVQTAPAGALMAFSGETSWVLKQPTFQAALARYPMAERTLEIFLQHARINPALEKGRISFYLMDLPKEDGPAALEQGFQSFLIQLGGFREPHALESALAEAFPPEGSLRLDRQDCPLYMIMDVNRVRIRALAGPGGVIWIGDLAALNTLAARGTLPPRHAVLGASEWTSAKAPFQGFIQPEPFVAGLRARAQGAGFEIPTGVEALSWSMTPPSAPGGLYQFELALAGSPEGIRLVNPWLQRLVAATTALQGGQGSAPEITGEAKRVSLRAQMTEAQLGAIMSRLQQPFGSLTPAAQPPEKAPRPAAPQAPRP